MPSTAASTQKALVLEALGTDLSIQSAPIPSPFHGSVVIRILAAGVISYHREIYSTINERPYPFPVPLCRGLQRGWACGSSWL